MPLAVIELDFPPADPRLPPSLQIPAGSDGVSPSAGRHALRTLGILLARPDGTGVGGLCPEAGPVHLGTAHRGLARAIHRAAVATGPGGVILIEGQLDITDWDPAARGPIWGPVECDREVQRAIRNATANGVTVVEPAGNTAGLDLGGLIRPGGDRVFAVDSGAVIVGSVHPTDHRPLGPVGIRIDCWGWGAGVTTLDALPHRSDGWTTNHGGTSAAAALIAGAAVLLQSGQPQPLPPAAIRSRLADRTRGTAARHPRRLHRDPTLCGVLPDVGALLDPASTPARR